MAEQKVSLRFSALWGAMVFGVTLAVIIGVRLDQAALAVMTGVVCGVAASIPSSLLIVSLMRRRDVRDGQEGRRGLAQSQPPQIVLVVPPNVPQLAQPTAWADGYTRPQPAQREFSVIGDEEIEELW